jgi:hypothetical protein
MPASAMQLILDQAFLRDFIFSSWVMKTLWAKQSWPSVNDGKPFMSFVDAFAR